MCSFSQVSSLGAGVGMKLYLSRSPLDHKVGFFKELGITSYNISWLQEFHVSAGGGLACGFLRKEKPNAPVILLVEIRTPCLN